jgi:membrane-associated protease RseP (regulator of RpoE activity)
MRRCIGEIVVCMVGLSASVIPFLVYTDPFWGIGAFTEGEPFAATSAPGVTILQVDSGSPAASAGLQKGDRIVKVNGKPAGFAVFRNLLHAIEFGQAMTLEGQRGGEDLRLEFRGKPQVLEGVLFLDWQFVSAPVFLVLLLLHIATQPLDPPPLWREILTTLGGLAVVTATAIVEAGSSQPWTWVWQSKAISHAPSPGLHYSLAAIAMLAGLILAFLGAFRVRAVLARRSSEPARPVVCTYPRSGPSIP